MLIVCILCQSNKKCVNCIVYTDGCCANCVKSIGKIVIAIVKNCKSNQLLYAAFCNSYCFKAASQKIEPTKRLSQVNTIVLKMRMKPWKGPWKN